MVHSVRYAYSGEGIQDDWEEEAAQGGSRAEPAAGAVKQVQMTEEKRPLKSNVNTDVFSLEEDEEEIGKID